MPNYLHIGGAKDGQLFPVAHGAGAAAGFDLYILDSLSVGVSQLAITIPVSLHEPRPGRRGLPPSNCHIGHDER